jgi:hypothetical protein
MAWRTICLVYLLFVGSSAWQESAGQSQEFSHVPIPDETPAGEIALGVSGLIGSTSPVVLDLETIMAFPRTTITCTCPWMDLEHDYTGVLLLSLLESLGLDDGATSIEVRAANRYSVRIRIEDLRRHRYVLAYQMDGTLLGRRSDLEHRGALITAIDFAPEYDVDLEVYKYQFVWQVNEIVVL